MNVVEDPDNLRLATNYAYDVQGMLTQVSQDTQTRTFGNSSLGRLISAANPESGLISYTYDDNGNLKTRIDNKGNVTNYVFDVLDRLLKKTYSNDTGDTAYTPVVTY